jgi:hypothetical protein
MNEVLSKDALAAYVENLEDKISAGNGTMEEVNQYEKLKKVQIYEMKAVREQKAREKDSVWMRVLKVIEVIGTVGVSIGGLLLYKEMYEEGLKFEETGTFTSMPVKDLFRRVKTK